MTEIPNEVAGKNADPRVELAVMRTELAWDRTLLAWLRTTSALIAAGFAFDRGTKLLHEARLAAGTDLVRSGHLVGLTLTATSTVLLIFVCSQYWRDMTRLERVRCTGRARLTPALLANGLLILLGAAVFFMMLPGGE